MNSQPEEQDVEIIALVSKLRAAPERSQQAAVVGKSKFLAEARSYALPLPLPLTPSPNGRHQDWKTVFTRKMQPRMAIIPILIVIFMLVFMGTGVTVFSAQSSLPDQPLYGVKLASEIIRAGLPSSNQTRLEMAMDFADLRLQETLQLAVEGKPIPETVLARMENHLDLALYTAAALNDQQLAQQLLTIQSRMKLELEKLAQLEGSGKYSNTVERVRAALLSRLQLVTIGLADPAAFRQYMQSDQRHSGWPSVPTASPAPTNTITPQPTQVKPTNTAQPTLVTPTKAATARPQIVPTTAPKPTSQWNNNNNNCKNCCQDCGGNWGGNWGGGSGGHDGGSGGGGGGWHH